MFRRALVLVHVRVDVGIDNIKVVRADVVVAGLSDWEGQRRQRLRGIILMYLRGLQNWRGEGGWVAFGVRARVASSPLIVVAIVPAMRYRLGRIEIVIASMGVARKLVLLAHEVKVTRTSKDVEGAPKFPLKALHGYDVSRVSEVSVDVERFLNTQKAVQATLVPALLLLSQIGALTHGNDMFVIVEFNCITAEEGEEKATEAFLIVFAVTLEGLDVVKEGRI